VSPTEALKKIIDAATYPVSTEIDPKGFALRPATTDLLAYIIELAKGDTMTDSKTDEGTPVGAQETLEYEEQYLIEHLDAECGIMRGDIEGSFHRIREALSQPSATDGAVRAAVIEEIARWHDDQSQIAMDSLHCGDNTSTIAAARRKADHHTQSAEQIRALTNPGDEK